MSAAYYAWAKKNGVETASEFSEASIPEEELEETSSDEEEESKKKHKCAPVEKDDITVEFESGSGSTNEH